VGNIKETISKHLQAIDWLRTRCESGSSVASVCTGAFLLAETGLLDERTATTHWGFTRLFNQRYPKVNLKPKRLITDEGNLFCLGGVYSGIDLSIYLVEKLGGHETAVQCSKAVIHEYVRRSQDPYGINLSRKDHKGLKTLAV
jgi:transcriptional regulator GlxA family with amidase domain